MLIALPPLTAQAGQNYQVYVSNEKSGDVTVINGSDNQVLRHDSGRQASARYPCPVRRQDGVCSPERHSIARRLSWMQRQSHLPEEQGRRRDDGVKADKSADAIGIVDVAKQKLTGKISTGSDPEEFSLSKTAPAFTSPNEDVKTASVITIASGQGRTHRLGGPGAEGVATTPDGKRFYGHLRSRRRRIRHRCRRLHDSRAFQSERASAQRGFFAGYGRRFYFPSESTGELNVIVR